jgi:2-keto-myo-inositol isomerase
MNPLALNTVTIKQVEDVRDQIRIAGEAGYDGIGLWFDAIDRYVEGGGSLADLARLLREANLSVPEACFVGGWMGVPEQERAQALEAAEKAFETAAAIGAETVIACAAGHEVEPAVAAAHYRDLCERAAEYGIVPALEFLGMAATVKDIKTAARIVREAGHGSGGILLDTFHFHRGGSEPGDILELGGAPVAMCHVNDAGGKPRAELTDLDRVFCGAGELPLLDMFRNLAEAGYEGAYSVEIFNEEYWARDPLAVAREGRETLAGLLGQL